jgi:hypothetical protein
MQTSIQSLYHFEPTAQLFAIFVLMLLAPYWLGPIRIKFKQSRPATPQGMQPVADPASLPPLLTGFVNGGQRALGALGFGNFAILKQGEGVVLLAESEPGTVATALAIQKSNGQLHALVGFTTKLRGGTRLRTSNSPLAAITPAPADESRLRLPAERDVGRLYALHKRRVAEATAGGAAVERLAIGDPVAYQHREELSSIAQFVNSGYWQRNGDRLVLTWKGAFLSAWRLLPPWRDISRRRDERYAAAVR